MKKMSYFLLIFGLFFLVNLKCYASNAYISSIGTQGNTGFYAVIDKSENYTSSTCNGEHTRKYGGGPYGKYCRRNTSAGVKDLAVIAYTPVYIKYNGKSYKSFCVDPNVSSPDVNTKMTCTAISLDNKFTAAMAWIYTDIKDKDAVAEVEEGLLALRFYAEKAHVYKYSSVVRQAIIDYHLAYSSGGASVANAADHYGTNGSDEVSALKTYVEKAATKSASWITSAGTSATSSSDYKVKFTKVSTDAKNKKVTFKVTVKPAAELEFSCSGNCTIKSVKLTKGSNKYTYQFIAKFNGDLTECQDYSINYNFKNVSTSSSSNAKNGTLYHCTASTTSSNTKVQSFVFFASSSDGSGSSGSGDSGSSTSGYDDRICSDECEVTATPDLNQAAMCCEDSTKAHYLEPLIRDLFCDTSTDTVQVTGNVVSDAANSYFTQKVNNYCNVYCDERIDITVPDSGTTARNGKYFDFNWAVPGVSKGPYFVGYKTCRLITDYTNWEKNYITYTENAVAAYNIYQAKKAYSASMTEAKQIFDGYSAKRLSSSVNRTATYKGTVSRSADSSGGSCSANVSEPKTVSCKFYAKAQPKQESSAYHSYYYKTVEIEYEYGGSSAINEYYGLNIIAPLSNRTSKNGSYTDDNKYYETSWNEDSNAEKICNAPATMTHSESCTYTCYGCCHKDDTSKTKNASGNYPQIYYDCDQTYTATVTLVFDSVAKGDLSDVTNTSNFNSKVSNAATAATNANTTFSSYSNGISIMETELNTCNNYFSDGAGYDKSNYDMDINVSFQYHQVYVENSSNQITVKKNDMPFKSNKVMNNAVLGDDSQTDYNGNDLGLNSEQYNSKNGHDEVSVKNFKGGTATTTYTGRESHSLNYNVSTRSYKQKYVTDAYYSGTVSTTDEDHTYYTLYPYGSVSTTKTEYSVKNNKKYYAEYSALSGKFLTLWDVSGLGTGGKFDQYFKDAASCANDANVNEFTSNAGFTCDYKVESELTKLQGCSASHVISANNYQTECCNGGNCNYSGGDELTYSFKIVDPNDLFPACSALKSNYNVGDNQFNDCYSANEYGYNWLQTDAGKSALNAIQREAANDTIYSEANKTFAIYLSESDLTKIKEYNSKQSKSYSDFNMTCKCAGGADVSNCETHFYDCKSNFLAGIYAGSLTGVSGNLSVTGRSAELNSLRSGNSHLHIAG